MSARHAAARLLVVARVAAPKAMLLIEDSAGGELPFAATASSIAVGCASVAATEIRLGDIGIAPAGDPHPAFDGRLATPTRKLAVRTLLGATLLEVTVPTADTQVRVWTNAATEPTVITIGVARAASGIAR